MNYTFYHKADALKALNEFLADNDLTIYDTKRTSFESGKDYISDDKFELVEPWSGEIEAVEVWCEGEKYVFAWWCEDEDFMISCTSATDLARQLKEINCEDNPTVIPFTYSVWRLKALKYPNGDIDVPNDWQTNCIDWDLRDIQWVPIEECEE